MYKNKISLLQNSLISKYLNERKKYLVNQIKQLGVLKKPEKRLKICKHGNNYSYFLCDRGDNHVGTYVKKSNLKPAINIANFDYQNALLTSIKAEIKAIELYEKNLPKVCAEKIFDELSPGRKILINPLFITNEEFANNWQEEVFAGKDFDGFPFEYFSERGERVRSKSEIIIANTLFHNGIPYHYEKPLLLNDTLTVYPDFTILKVSTREEIYWEHFGLIDNPEYAEKMLLKINSYESSGIYLGKNLIATFESSSIPLNPKRLNTTIQQYILN